MIIGSLIGNKMLPPVSKQGNARAVFYEDMLTALYKSEHVASS